MNILRRSQAIFFLAIIIALFTLSDRPASGESSGGSGRTPEKITINFVDVELSSIARIMSEITGMNIIFGDDLKGRVTIVAPAKLNAHEALKLFTTALELKGFALLPADGAWKIVPLAVAKQSGSRVISGPGRLRPGDAYVVRLATLKFISHDEAMTSIRPFISRYGQVTSFGTKNALLIVDSAQNVKKIMEILSALDRPPEITPPEIVYLEYAQAEDVAEVLQAEAAVATGGKKGAKGAKEEVARPDMRLNAVILSGPVYLREHLKRFIRKLDVPAPEASSRINVYYLENADAEELATTLKALTAPENGKNSAGRPSSGVKELRGAVSITPDRASNALIIMASPADYQALKEMIKKLDRRPKQVLVEAMITEVSIDKALELGAKWRVTGEVGGEPVAIGGVGTIDSSVMSDILNGLAGLSLGGLGNFITVPVTASDGSTFNLTAPGFAALFSLSELKDAVNVLSTPHILTSDNSEAEIVVGENVPFLSSIERSSETTGQPLLQSIERQDVGIKLKIKPKISDEGYVKLDIYQEISSISPTTVFGAADIITTKRSARTTVVVKNDQTVVIGGLIQRKKTRSSSRVPVLSKIPFLGWLFNFRSEQTEKTNVLVFMTPHIIKSVQGFEEMRKKKIEEFNSQSSYGEEDEQR